MWSKHALMEPLALSHYLLFNNYTSRSDYWTQNKQTLDFSAKRDYQNRSNSRRQTPLLEEVGNKQILSARAWPA
jgi:hypothetical protein